MSRSVSLYTSGGIRGLNSVFGVIGMSLKDLVLLCIVILGVVAFLYGSNYFDATIGWGGISLVVAGCVAEIVLELYSFVRKKRG
jgi:arginine exporter protein ArgO